MSVARSPPWGACGEVCAGQPGAGRAPALGPGGGFWLKARFPVTFYFETIAGMLSSGESGDTCVPALAALCSLPVRASVRGSRLAHGRGPVRGLALSRAGCRWQPGAFDVPPSVSWERGVTLWGRHSVAKDLITLFYAHVTLTPKKLF